MIFQSPYWLLVAVLLVAVFVLFKRLPTDNWQRYIHHSVLEFLRAGNNIKSQRLPALLLAALAALALANPSLPNKNAESFHQSEAWFVLADLSRSMTLNDVTPTRLSAMRDSVLKFAQQSDSRPISLIIYAGDAFMITPPAFDTQHFISNAVLLEYGLIPHEGSSLTRALSLTASVIGSSQLLKARIFILGDTGGINSKAQAAASHLAARGHAIDLIVFGSENGNAGAEFDLEAASALARTGKGIVIQADPLGRVSLDALNLDRSSAGSDSLISSGVTLLHWHSLSPWVLLPAIALLLLLFIRERT